MSTLVVYFNIKFYSNFSEEELRAAKTATLLLYDKSIDALSNMTQDQVALAFERSNIVDLIYDTRLTAFELAMKVNCFKSTEDAVRIINAGGFYINYRRVTDVDQVIKPGVHILPNNVTLIRTGKKTYHVVRWMELRRAEEVK